MDTKFGTRWIPGSKGMQMVVSSDVKRTGARTRTSAPLHRTGAGAVPGAVPGAGILEVGAWCSAPVHHGAAPVHGAVPGAQILEVAAKCRCGAVHWCESFQFYITSCEAYKTLLVESKNRVKCTALAGSCIEKCDI